MRKVSDYFVLFKTNSLKPFMGKNTIITKLLYCAFFLICANISYGQEGREDDKFDIPYELLVDSRREEVREIVEKPTILRILRDIEFKTDESILIFMLGHPIFLSATLRAMNIKDYLIKHDKEGMYFFDDRKGVSGKYDVIYSIPGQKYYYGSGGYNGLLLNLTGRGVVLLEYRKRSGNPPGVSINANVYAVIDNVVLRVLMKILKPIVIPLIDRKLYKFIKGTQKLAKEITMHPEEVYQAVKESGYADNKELEEFRKLIF